MGLLNKKKVPVASPSAGKESQNGKIDTFESKQAPIFNFKNRRCPWFDWIMIPVFIGFWIGMFIVAGFGISTGNPLTLINPVDYQQNVCGYAIGQGNKNKYDLTNQTYLWFPIEFSVSDLKDITQSQIFDALNLGICVESCPTATAPDINSVVCTYDISSSTNYTKYDKYLRALQNKGGCFFNLFTTSSTAQRCLPSFTTNSTAYKLLGPTQAALLNKVLYFSDGLKTGVNELYASYTPILLSVFLCVVLCFLSICFIGVFIGILTYTVIFLVWLILAAGGGYSLYIGIIHYQKDGDTDFARVWLAVGGILLGGLLLYSFLFLWMWSRLRVAINVIRAASKAVVSLPGLFVVPVVGAILIVAFGVYWFIIEAYLASSTSVTYVSASSFNTLSNSTSVTSLQKSGALINSNFTQALGNSSIAIGKGNLAMQVLQAYHLFGILWMLAFISAFSYTVMAGAVGNWYFSAKGDKKKPPMFTVLASFARTLVFHTGSILIGSLIVAIVQFIRYLFQKLKQKALQKNKWAKYVVKIVEVALCILEAIVKFVNKNAYIIIAIHGTGFCMSAQRGFKLVLTNVLRFAAVNTIGEFILFLAQLIITVTCGIFTYAFIQLNNTYSWNIVIGVNYGLVPTIASGFIAFCISSLAMQVYHCAIDTILMCFVYDIDIHNPGDYYMGGALRALVNRSEKKQEPV
ncbi:choline transporter-like protein [Acrasis kona]|uniref:Choline transporter-like protein n=1 Tax=Acrasis kona TaxID=1008807 RepID=A0AAW2YZD5_9EUKA